MKNIFLFLVMACSSIAFSQMDSLRSRIQQIVEHSAGRIGVAVINVHNRDTVTVNGNGKFPMQSVYKFPVALAVLDLVDKGKLSLDQRIRLTKSDLRPNTWSPLREKYPNANVDVTLDELITNTVSISDNNGCDVLFRLAGGPGNVERYVRSLGISHMAIVSSEQEMSTDWNIQYRNWSSPAAMASLLCKFYQDSILSPKSRDYLWQIMVNTSTGPGRIKGLLPIGTVVGHKTGSSGTNDSGLAAATNDAGIIILPNNKIVAVVVFVSDSNAQEKVREKIIADIAKTVWDVYSAR